MSDPFDLERFVRAQTGVHERALAELQAGEKRSHWMWFIFPQIAGLGSSSMAQTYAIASLDEARAYLAHPMLGPRLVQDVDAVLGHDGKSAESIFGGVDAMKFRSCLTLFRAAAPEEPRFQRALDAFFAGQPDERTLARLR